MKTESKKEVILNMLKSSGKKGCTNIELSKVSLRYGGHLGILYKKGYGIDKESVGDGVYNYVLVSEPDETFRLKKNAYDELFSKVEKEVYVNVQELKSIFDEVGLTVRYKAGTHTNRNEVVYYG